jgi:hypothetical protein
MRVQPGRRLLSVDLIWSAPNETVRNSASVSSGQINWSTLPSSTALLGVGATLGTVVQTQFSGGNSLLWTKSTVNVTQPQPAYSETLEYWLDIMLGSTAEFCALRAIRINTQG